MIDYNFRKILPFKNYNYFVIYKNGFSTLSDIYMKQIGFANYDWTDIINQYNKITPNDNRSFMVYRDPYKRFVSLYTELVTHGGHEDIRYKLGLNRPFTECTEDEIKNIITSNYFRLFEGGNRCNIKSFEVDSHTCNFTNYICDDDIDVIVDIKDLNKFIKNELKYNDPIISKNVSDHNIDTSWLEQFKYSVQNYYYKDYKFYERNSSKLYKG